MTSTNRAITLAASAALVALTHSPAHAGSPPTYSAQVLGPGILINAMNESGEIVGWTTNTGTVRAYIAGPNHPYELLPLPTGYLSSWAQGINDLGVVVGSVDQGGLPEQGEAIAWVPDGNGGYSFQFLGALPGHTSSVAYAINNKGQIVGSSITPGFQGGPTVWFNSPSGVMNIAALGAPSSPKDINEQSVLIGINGDYFDLDTLSPTPLAPLVANMSGAQLWGINNHNHVAGAMFYGGGPTSRGAIRWTDASGWQSLGGIFGASSQMCAYDINDSGLTVLETSVSGSFSFQPAAHFDSLGLFTLQQLLEPAQASDWIFFANLGEAVNNQGQIAAIGRHAPTNQSGVVILTPDTQPCPGDLNGDNTVNFTDLNIVLSNFGATGAPGIPGDANNDGVVNFADLNTVLSFFGQAC